MKNKIKLKHGGISLIMVTLILMILCLIGTIQLKFIPNSSVKDMKTSKNYVSDIKQEVNSFLNLNKSNGSVAHPFK